MNRMIEVVTMCAALWLGSAIISSSQAQTAAEEHNVPAGHVKSFLAPGSAQPTRGVVFFTAAVNSDGTVASCFGCNTANTKKLGTGEYQIDFGQNVQAINGWSRWLQPDTLTIGTENVWCNAADRLGDNNAVWVNCQTSGGPGSQGNSKPADASFFLFVAR
jgi:hypothetical protein